MSSVGFLIFDGLWREICARVSRFVRSASGRTAEKRRNLARSKMRGFLRVETATEMCRDFAHARKVCRSLSSFRGRRPSEETLGRKSSIWQSRTEVGEGYFSPLALSLRVFTPSLLWRHCGFWYSQR